MKIHQVPCHSHRFLNIRALGLFLRKFLLSLLSWVTNTSPTRVRLEKTREGCVGPPLQPGHRTPRHLAKLVATKSSQACSVPPPAHLSPGVTPGRILGVVTSKGTSWQSSGAA